MLFSIQNVLLVWSQMHVYYNTVNLSDLILNKEKNMNTWTINCTEVGSWLGEQYFKY